MTDPNRSLIAVLLDRSGSMESIKSDTEGGFNAFIGEQRGQAGDVRVTLAQFDTEYEVVYPDRPVGEVPPLDLQPRGATALYDALGRLITDIGANLAGRPEAERPGKVTIVVLTDGHENSSGEWTHKGVRSAIHRQESEFSWDFLFLGANIDAVATGEQLGFKKDRSMTYAASGVGVAAAFSAASSYLRRSAAAPVGEAVAGFSDEDRLAAQGDTTR
jgi:hypothetical protein